MADVTLQPEQATLPGIDRSAPDKSKTSSKNVSEAKPAVDGGPPNLGKPIKVTVPNFAQPNRAKTCLEVDFPIVPVNALSRLEGNAGKPIYQMSKWWARRRSSVFRAILIAAATQAPSRKNADGSEALDNDGLPVPDETETAKAVWDLYYANHQKAGNFKDLRVLDCFMGGGTTLVEGSRLGFQVAGVDLNPVAWFVTKNELACTDPDEVRLFFDRIEAELKPVIQPFYVTECPRGHRGRWYRIATDDQATDALMPTEFDPLRLPPEEREQYRYAGPESIYTFWAKHGVCSRQGCGHRTPIFRSPVIAEKKLGVKYIELTCKSCKTSFHAELGAARMAPGSERVILDSEFPFTEISQPFARLIADYSKGNAGEKRQRVRELSELVEAEPGLKCPKCGEFSGQYLRDIFNSHRSAERVSEIDKKHLKIQPSANSTKHVYCYLLVDPDWLKGAQGVLDGVQLGGSADSPVDASSLWWSRRLENLRLIEVRGRVKLADDTTDDGHEDAELILEPMDDESTGAEQGEGEAASPDRKEYGLPKFITVADGRRIDTRRGTIPQQSHFICGHCGKKQDARASVEQFGHTAPVAVYAIQGYCPDCDNEGRIYGGRFFAAFSSLDQQRLVCAEHEWHSRRDSDLSTFWPREEIPQTYMTHHANFALPKQGYTHWSTLFNSRQLLLLALLLRSITDNEASQEVTDQALGAFQQYVRMQNMFVIWHQTYDKIAPFMSNPNFAPKARVVENNVYGKLGYGTWKSCTQTILDGLSWCRDPNELYITAGKGGAQSIKVQPGDAVRRNAEVHCGSSSELPQIGDRTVDLVITDPPFGDNIFYSDLANFFYVWLRLPLQKRYREWFGGSQTPNAQEALAPRLLAEGEANEYYKVRLTACWTEACRVLKDYGLLAFTFHHSDELQWALVLESLFEAGFVLEQTFPIVSDEQKGEGGQYGAKGTEYDMIHVCRKRLIDPVPVSWAKMRQWVKAELNRLKLLLVSYKENELSDSDIRVILRGKALEFYSRHFGQVLTSDDEALSIRHALGGINQLLDEGSPEASGNPPSIVQPVAYQYLRLFTVRPSRTPDDVSKSLFGTAIRQRDFEDRRWVEERNRLVSAVPIRQRFENLKRRPRKEMKTEIDQAHFLIGSAVPGSGVNLEQELSRDTWLVRKSVDAVLDWYSKLAPEPEVRDAAQLARAILRQTLDGLRQRPAELDRQLKMFNDWDEEM